MVPEKSAVIGVPLASTPEVLFEMMLSITMNLIGAAFPAGAKRNMPTEFPTTCPDSDTGSADDAHVLELHLRAASSRRLNQDAAACSGGAMFAEYRVLDDQFRGTAWGKRNPESVGRCAGRTANQRILHRQRTAVEKTDSIQVRRGGRGSIDVEALDEYIIGGGRIDDDPVGGRMENACSDPHTDQRDRFGDRHRAIGALVDAIDLAPCRSLRDRAGERLARCGTAAWIGVVADTRDPSPRCLRRGRRGVDEATHDDETGSAKRSFEE